MKNQYENKTPNEIPNKNTPHDHSPLKDPTTPSKDNPINPNTDEPTKK